MVSRESGELLVADAWCHASLAPPAGDATLPAEGSWVLARGSWDGHCFQATSLEVHAGAAPQGTGEHARLAWTGRAHHLVARDVILRAIREYFQSEDFVEVETPSLVPCPGLDPHVHSLGGVERGVGLGVGRRSVERDFLITSPELHLKRLIVGGMPRIFEVARCFRAEELGRRHEPEFTLVEWYRAFAPWTEVLADTERLLARAASATAGSTSVTAVVDNERRELRLAPPFERLTVREAFQRYAAVRDAVALARDDETRFYELLVQDVEPALAREDHPIFLTHYPVSQAPLARPCPDDPTVAERFELYVAGIELCNGFGELTDGAEQRRRFEMERARRARTGEPVYPLDERFLAALTEGMPPSAGNALGLDRLAALLCGHDEVALVQAFPAQDR